MHKCQLTKINAIKREPQTQTKCTRENKGKKFFKRAIAWFYCVETNFSHSQALVWGEVPSTGSGWPAVCGEFSLPPVPSVQTRPLAQSVGVLNLLSPAPHSLSLCLCLYVSLSPVYLCVTDLMWSGSHSSHVWKVPGPRVCHIRLWVNSLVCP